MPYAFSARLSNACTRRIAKRMNTAARANEIAPHDSTRPKSAKVSSPGSAVSHPRVIKVVGTIQSRNAPEAPAAQIGEAQKSVGQKCLCSFAPQTRPDKHAGEKKHEMHQIDILGRAEQVEAKPSLAVQDGDRSPVIRRAIEGRRRGRLRPEVGENGMERHYQEDDERPKITQC